MAYVTIGACGLLRQSTGLEARWTLKQVQSDEAKKRHRAIP